MMAWRAGGLAIGVISGIVAAANGWPVSLWLLIMTAALGGAALVVSIMMERRWNPWPKSLVALAALIAALPIGYLRTMDVIGAPQEGSLRAFLETIEPGTRLTVRGTVAAEPEVRGAGQLDIELRVREIRAGDDDAEWVALRRGRLLFRAYTRANNDAETHEFFNRLAAPAAYGWTLEMASTYRPIEAPLNPGTFDYGRFLIQSGVDTRLRNHVNAVTVLEESPGHFMMEWALMAKTSFLETFKKTVRSPASRLTSAATLGARRAVEHIDYRDQDLATTLRHAGVGHVLAVSGLHVSVIAVMLFALFRMTGAKPRQFVPILILLLIMFALLTGARPSSVRAVIMNSVVLIAIAYLRSDFRSATVIGLSLSSFFILMRNPTVLFAPSFLLSYGAVLSLIVIAPPLDRLICALRGFALCFAAVWFVILLRLAGWHLDWLIQPVNLFSYLGILWLLIIAGGWLNHRFPAMWTISLERIPTLVRLFFAAQLAIQFGMMIPMSAWFFGLFPVAGVLVNLIAIPAVGVLVQLGMLTGLIGMIPWLGQWLAIPFGAATTLTGDFFIFMAYVGTSVFPYPATPMPTTFWMIAYYVLLAVFLLLEGKRTTILNMFYRLIPPGPAKPWRRWVILVPVLMVIAPSLQPQPDQPKLDEVRILAEGRYPIVMLTGPQNATLINAGGAFAGGRLVFDSLRANGATRLDYLLLPSPDPRAGMAGAAELITRMQVDRILTLVHPASDQTLPEALGDTYVVQQAARGTGWAVNLVEGYETLRERAREVGVPLAAMEVDTLPQWSNASLEILPLPDTVPNRFASSAMTPILKANINGLDWIFITDTTPQALFTALSETTSTDVLVVPNLSNFSSYGNWLRTALIRTKPRVLIIGGDDEIEAGTLRAWLPTDEERVIFQTGVDGAIIARLRANGETHLRTHRTGEHLTLTPQ